RRAWLSLSLDFRLGQRDNGRSKAVPTGRTTPRFAPWLGQRDNGRSKAGNLGRRDDVPRCGAILAPCPPRSASVDALAHRRCRASSCLAT
ncbi:MAG: hypothetical protein QOI09_339, partial [Chloroflexota bacterium]|nr:hypothetical protein [Chloroflexota bacterium]